MLEFYEFAKKRIKLNEKLIKIEEYKPNDIRTFFK